MSFVLWAERNRMFTMLSSCSVHKQLLWWATKSDDISAAHNTYNTQLQFKFPHGNYDFWPFCSQQRQKQRMNCEKCRLLVPLWVVCKQVDLISYPRTHTHTRMYVCAVALCQRSSQHYLHALIPLLLNLDWCNSTYGRLNCTCTCNVQFSFCGFSTASHCACERVCLCMFFRQKFFPTHRCPAIYRVIAYNRLKAT